MAKEITRKITVYKGSSLQSLVKKMVDLWYETQMGCMHKCRKKQHEFADVMWELYNDLHPEDDG